MRAVRPQGRGSILCVAWPPCHTIGLPLRKVGAVMGAKRPPSGEHKPALAPCQGVGLVMALRDAGQMRQQKQRGENRADAPGRARRACMVR